MPKVNVNKPRVKNYYSNDWFVSLTVNELLKFSWKVVCGSVGDGETEGSKIDHIISHVHQKYDFPEFLLLLN